MTCNVEKYLRKRSLGVNKCCFHGWMNARTNKRMKEYPWMNEAMNESPLSESERTSALLWRGLWGAVQDGASRWAGAQCRDVRRGGFVDGSKPGERRAWRPQPRVNEEHVSSWGTGLKCAPPGEHETALLMLERREDLEIQPVRQALHTRPHPGN